MSADFKQGSNLEGKVLASSQVASAATNTTVYTVPASSAVKIASAAIFNASTGTVTASVSVVPSGGTVDGTHKIVSVTLAAGETTTLPELVNAMLDTGAFISLNCSAAAALNYLITGAVSS